MLQIATIVFIKGQRLANAAVIKESFQNCLCKWLGILLPRFNSLQITVKRLCPRNQTSCKRMNVAPGNRAPIMKCEHTHLFRVKLSNVEQAILVYYVKSALLVCCYRNIVQFVRNSIRHKRGESCFQSVIVPTKLCSTYIDFLWVKDSQIRKLIIRIICSSK